MYKSMFRPEVIRRDELCFFRPCAKLPSLQDREPRTSEIHHVVLPAERSTSVYINLVQCVYHCFTFSLVLGVSPIPKPPHLSPGPARPGPPPWTALLTLHPATIDAPQ